jgi:2-hydroxychromene-2-carboxylate isomerase
MTDKARVEFFYDLSSPWTYLAFTNLQGVLDRTGSFALYRPILVGGVFNAVNQSVYASRDVPDAQKVQHAWKVLKDWARLTGVTMEFPSRWHPVKSVAAMRMACALADEQAALVSFSTSAFEAYFGRSENLDDADVLVAAADAVGLDGASLFAKSQTDDVKALLRANTDEAITRGGYGSPTIFVDGTDMYFGNDQLPLVEAALSPVR